MNTNLIPYNFAFFYDLVSSKAYRKKISHIYHHLSLQKKKFDPNGIASHRVLWKPLRKSFDIRWFKVFSEVFGKADPRFIPEEIYYTIVEPTMNQKAFAKGFTDKNLYDLTLEKSLFPETLLRKINGVYYRADYSVISLLTEEILLNELAGCSRIIIKPSVDGGGGYMVKAFCLSNQRYLDGSDELNTEYLKQYYPDNCVIQKYVVQHAFFRQFNESSLNTVRLFTYRDVNTEEIHLLHALLRFGKPDSITDNQASGGFSAGISAEGLINPYAIDKKGIKYTHPNNVNLGQKIRVPFFNELCHAGRKLAAKSYYARLLGFDFCIDEHGNVRLIEINCVNNEINFYQMNNGPLFGEFTNDVIEYCRKSPVSYCFDYNIKK